MRTLRSGPRACLDRDRGAVGQGFRALGVGQFQVREAAGPEIVDAMHTPIGALLPGLEMQVPSARRIVRPGQCSAWLADFAASRWSVTALRKSTE